MVGTLIVRRPIVCLSDNVKLEIEVQADDLTECDEIVVSISTNPCEFPASTHIHFRTAGRRSYVLKCSKPILSLIIEARRCIVAYRRPQLRSDIVIHSSSTPITIVRFVCNNHHGFAELLAGGGLALHNGRPYLKGRGSVLVCDYTVFKKRIRVLCLHAIATALRRKLQALLRIFSQRFF